MSSSYASSPRVLLGQGELNHGMDIRPNGTKGVWVKVTLCLPALVPHTDNISKSQRYHGIEKLNIEVVAV